VTDASQADQSVIPRLKEALALIDVPVLDHLIVAARLEATTSRGPAPASRSTPLPGPGIRAATS
jgi:hypothetical protein